MEAVKKITQDQIYTELESVLNYSALKNSPILSRFLKHIVTETINEKQHLIKEYSIAVNVLNRSQDFNSHDDSVVRIHAGRLRRFLDEFYNREGRNNSIRIVIPKGCYIPQFIHKGTENPAVSSHDIANPVIAIFPFKTITEKHDLDVFSLLICEELSAELSRFQDISVIGNFSSEILFKINQNTLEAAKLIGADFVMTGSLKCHKEKLLIRINLLNALTGHYILTKSFEYDSFEDIMNIQNWIVQNVVSAMGGYYGIIFKEVIKTHPSKISDNSSIWKGVYAYYQYQRGYSNENYQNALNALKTAVKLHPNHAVSWAMLGEFYLDGIALGIDDDANTISEAYSCLMRSIKIDPDCQHAMYALTWVNLFRRDPEACLIYAEKCIAINSHSSGMVSGVGCLLIFAGYFETGFQIMDDAIRTNPIYPWWINIGYCYYYIYKGDYKNAFFWAEKMDCAETFWDPLLKSVSLSFLNEDVEAKKYLVKLIELEPNTALKIKGMISSYILTENVVSNMIESLERIGLKLMLKN
ncbi:hypothetical protein DBB36_22400 [Flavobacterium sp. WLB]|uniref:tetratricopeptide repeat protein n=1 Tax=unclassified Flavobacterium TaxID=196869 RepID=UPI0006AB9E46|nr:MULTISPECIES: hypothetical protein [unclassified Flavobacterium]KOP38784.1 hypothetical protein AKO67_07000 [Flavobacterium sp. VMW]OWU92719.1 hypothetical protein APR43_01265 [Flavobacterium sp. NLM]PUU67734.1 hypothetical protein DBB36_22400 [Flavobacterium sp. WLB]